MVRHTDNYDEASWSTPGHKNRHVRLKYATISETLGEWRAGNAAIGRIKCPACDYLEAHQDEDPIAVEAYVYDHPEWGPWVLCEIIQNTPDNNNAHSHRYGVEICAAVQHDAAISLIQHPFESVRQPLQNMMFNPKTRFYSPAALYIVLSYINAHHPNPRRFLSKPAVQSKLPADLDVDLFAAPDFEEAAP